MLKRNLLFYKQYVDSVGEREAWIAAYSRDDSKSPCE